MTAKRNGKADHHRREPLPEEEAPRPRPLVREERDIEGHLKEAADWLEGARQVADDLVFTAQDATGATSTTGRSIFTRASLRRSAAEEGIELFRLLSYVKRSIDAARGAARERR